MNIIIFHFYNICLTPFLVTDKLCGQAQCQKQIWENWSSRKLICSFTPVASIQTHCFPGSPMYCVHSRRDYWKLMQLFNNVHILKYRVKSDPFPSSKAALELRFGATRNAFVCTLLLASPREHFYLTKGCTP